MKKDVSFKYIKLDVKELLKLGFVEYENNYKYETTILDNQFKLIIVIDSENMLISDVIEILTNEKFMPYYIASATGEFVGKIREEYDKIIKQIRNNCCSRGEFKSEYALLLIDYVKRKYNDELEYLWDKFPSNAIWRNKKSKKWYGALLTVQRKKIGVDEEGSIEVIDIQLEAEKIIEKVDNVKILPGYHMNKKHWITIKLDGSVPIEEIYRYLDHSYQITENKSKK